MWPGAAMITSLFDDTRAALAPLWAVKPPAPPNIYQHPEFVAFKTFCEERFAAADKGLGFSSGLANALRGAGLPCLMARSKDAASLDEGAQAIVAAFEAKSVTRRYLCPLDLADVLPKLAFGGASLQVVNANGLAQLLDLTRLRRHFPHELPDLARLAQFQWLIIEESAAAASKAGQRALPFLYESWARDFGAIDPHASRHPDPVEDALFGLLLAPWEDWHSLETDWRAFSIPWIYVATDDLFVRPQPVPSADTLTWEDAAYQDYDGDFVEYERPVRLSLADEAAQTLKSFDHGWWAKIEAALATPLFETPVKHFLVRAAFSDGMDQILAHITTIEAALGLRSDFHNKGRPKADRINSTQRVARRVAALLEDDRAGAEFVELFDMRSEYIHGRAIKGPVSSSVRDRARRLARRVTVALIDAANGPAAASTREGFLTHLARSPAGAESELQTDTSGQLSTSRTSGCMPVDR